MGRGGGRARDGGAARRLRGQRLVVVRHRGRPPGLRAEGPLGPEAAVRTGCEGRSTRARETCDSNEKDLIILHPSVKYNIPKPKKSTAAKITMNEWPYAYVFQLHFPQKTRRDGYTFTRTFT